MLQGCGIVLAGEVQKSAKEFDTNAILKVLKVTLEGVPSDD